jgi:hypothetical protein
LLKIYYACHCCVKILLKMLIYNLQTPLFRLILPCIGGAHNVFQKTCPCPSRKVEKKNESAEESIILSANDKTGISWSGVHQKDSTHR